MLDQLSERLQGAFRTLRGQDTLTPDNVADALRQVRRALLEADVSLPVLKAFLARVQDRALGQTAETGGESVLAGLDPDDHFIGVVHEELVKLLGGAHVPLNLDTQPTWILLFGLQGSGKTTTAAKLGRWLQKQGKQPLLVAADVYRPAAIDQLVTLGQQLGVPVHTLSGNTDVLDIVESAAARVRIEGQDAVIVDTAGRLQIDTQMMAELLMLERWLRTQDPAQPQEKLLVVDSMMGQEAVRVAEAFHTQLTMTGLVLTKMDGDARGGAALSVVEITGQPIKFIGVSEKPDGLEPFHPDRLASRILGMGDVVSLFEKAQEAIQLEDAQHMQSKFLQDNFSIDDFLQLQKQMSLFGSMDQILGMLPIPGLDKETREKMAHGGEQQMKRVSVMVQSMTARERAMPELLEQNPSRCLRIARGAGLPVEEVTAFVGQFMQMRQMMKQFAKLLSGDFNLFGLGDDDDDNDASPNPRMLGPGRPAGTYTNQQQLMHMRQKIEKSARKQKRKAPFIPPYHRP